jgi:pyridoxine 4-dehydrogenase
VVGRATTTRGEKRQPGLAWLLAHAPKTLLIPGTRSVAHLEENIGAANVALGADALERLDAVTAPGDGPQLHGIEPFREVPTA